MPWSGYANMEFSRNRGFKTLDDTGEWKRQGYIEQYDQIDTVGYLTHTWFKFPKYKLVNEEDYKLDPKMLADFLDFIDYEEEDFWNVVDRFANKAIVEKKGGVWRLKEPCR
jgi:hypothetical protein